VAPGSFTATCQEEAVADTARGGLLDFIPQVTNSTTSPDQIGRVTTASFTSFTGTLTGGTVAPSTVHDLNASGSVIGFNFGGWYKERRRTS